MSVVALFAFFVLGLIVGSFLNVYIVRHQTGIGYGGRSFCFSCGHPLVWYDLVPIISFLIQRGRCRYCGARISFRYLLVELFTGIVFVLIAAHVGISFSLFHILYVFLLLAIFSVLIAIAFYDIRHKIIPNNLVYSFIALTLAGLLFSGFWSGGDLSISNFKFQISNWIAGPVLAAPLVVAWFFSRGRWLGFGDAKLTLGIGWLLGLSGGFAALILGVWLGAIVGVMLVAAGKISKTYSRLFPNFKRITIKSEIPFAPFLILGTLTVFFLEISFTDIQSLFIF